MQSVNTLFRVSKWRRKTAAVLSAALLMPFFSPLAQAQLAAPPMPVIPVAASQFSAVGFIENIVLDSSGVICTPSHPSLRGGTITVNGQIIIVPCNTILQMPATSMTFEELFSLAPAGTTPGTTGLALSDVLPTQSGRNAALPSVEVRVEGNVISGQYVAGLIFVSQQSLNVNRGMVNYIDYANGVIHVGGVPNVASPTDTRIRVNDPVGRFGKSHGAPGSVADVIEPDFDARFTADTNNPTIRATTGYPMCIPRTTPYGNGAVEDPLCPIRNRPISPNCTSLPAANFPPFPATPVGQYCRTFAMALPPATITAALPACVGGVCKTDPTRQAPIVVGDSINFSGTLKMDAATGPFISAHTVTVDAGIYTQPGSQPAYVVIDEMLIGSNATPVAGLAQELKPEIRVEGFSTDPSALVDIYAVEVAPVSGMPNYVYQGSQPPTTGVLGRFRHKLPTGFLGSPTREMLVVSRTLCGTNLGTCLPNANTGLYANGLLAGSYQAPVFDYLWPENLVPGAPIVPANFQDLSFLFCGSGPLKTGSIPEGTVGPVVGQLDPTPWALPSPMPVFAATLCPTAKQIAAAVPGFLPPPQLTNAPPAPITAPLADAGVAQSVDAGAKVALSAAGSRDTNTPARALSYAWKQVAGPAVALTTPNAAVAGFTAPLVTSITTLQFQVTVSNGASSSTADASVTVKPVLSPVVTVASSAITADALTRVTLSATSNPATGVTWSWTQTSGTAVVLTGANTASAQFTTPAGPAIIGFQVRVTNALGLSTTVPVTVPVPGDSVSVVSATWSIRSARLTVIAQSSLPAAPTALFSTVATGNTVNLAQTAMTARAAGSAQCSGAVGPCWVLGPLNLTRPVATTTVTVSSNRGGRISVPVVITP